MYLLYLDLEHSKFIIYLSILIRFSATCFYIGNGLFITNYHFFEPSDIESKTNIISL